MNTMSLIISILMKILALTGTPNVSHQEILPITKCMVSETPPGIFQGKIMQSVNQGESWESLQDGLSKDINIRSMGIDLNTVYLGTKEAGLYSRELNNGIWVSENLAETFIHNPFRDQDFVSGIFSVSSGVFVHVSESGLLKKSKEKSMWVPFSTPEEIRYINDVKEDNKGNIYISSQQGIYVTEDNGKTWEQLYMTSWAGNMVLMNNSIIANSEKGVIRSEDQGKTWQRIFLNTYDGFHFSENNTSYNIMTFDNGIAALRSEWPFKSGVSGKFQVSVDGGKSWKLHTADNYLKNLEDVTSVVKHEGKIFCSYKEGVICSDDDGKNWKYLLKYKKDHNGPLLLIRIHNGILYCWEGVFGC